MEKEFYYRDSEDEEHTEELSDEAADIEYYGETINKQDDDDEEELQDRILYGGRTRDYDDDEDWESLGYPDEPTSYGSLSDQDIISEYEENKIIERYLEQEQEEENQQHVDYLRAEAKRLTDEDTTYDHLIQMDQKERREKILQEIFDTYSKISLTNLAKFLEYPDEFSLQKFLITLQGEKSFHIEGNDVIIPKERKLQTNKSSVKVVRSETQPVCGICGKHLEKKGQECPECKSKEMTCIVCKLPISPGSAIGFCSHCEVRGHIKHFQEWVKVNGKCPKCMKYLQVSGIVQQQA